VRIVVVVWWDSNRGLRYSVGSLASGLFWSFEAGYDLGVSMAVLSGGIKKQKHRDSMNFSQRQAQSARWLNGFGVGVSMFQRSVEVNQNGYARLQHRAPYAIALFNDTNLDADATVWVDTESIGTFRVRSGSHIDIKRPGHTNRQLIAVARDSYTARSAGVQRDVNNGRIRVVFQPGVEPEQEEFEDEAEPEEWKSMSLPRPMLQSRSSHRAAPAGMRRGAAAMSRASSALPSPSLAAPSGFMSTPVTSAATVLGNRTKQHFVDVPDLVPVGRPTTIDLLLSIEVPPPPRSNGRDFFPWHNRSWPLREGTRPWEALHRRDDSWDTRYFWNDMPGWFRPTYHTSVPPPLEDQPWM
jgi:hypothetical protein